MKKYFAIVSALAIGISAAVAEQTVIKYDQKFLTAPVRDSNPLFPDSLVFDTYAEEIEFPDLGSFIRLGNYNFPNLKKVTLGNMDYMPGGEFMDMPKLEEVIINGMVGHFDCSFASRCPNLKRIVFKGPVSSTGSGFSYDCPQLESVVFEGLVVSFGLDIYPDSKTPKLEKFDLKKGVLNSEVDGIEPLTADQLRNDKEAIAQLEQLARWQIEVLRAKDSSWMRRCAYGDGKAAQPLLAQLGSPLAEPLKEAINYAWETSDDVKTKREILKLSPGYAPDTLANLKFTYVEPTDSALTAIREQFKLDSIAGDGDDVSRIKNLLYWVHNNIRHDGSNGFPAGPRTLPNIYESARRDSCGYNCRALAISLTEALLAEGIPARYITCESKKWDTDGDCHVICVAWCESLGKWIWVDPTFAAYVTDEDGALLHPGEVRYRLQHDLPLVLNPDANWNNRSYQTKDWYLDNYMAKNLYIMSANLLNQTQPEGQSTHLQGYDAALVPQGSNYTNAYYITTDDEWFWQPPTKFQKSSTARSQMKIK